MTATTAISATIRRSVSMPRKQAQKALSCVYRVGERFGVRHVIDVLRGAKRQRITGSAPSTSFPPTASAPTCRLLEWENIFRQLIHLGYLVQDFTRFGVLGLSPAARPVLKGETRGHPWSAPGSHQA